MNITLVADQPIEGSMLSQHVQGSVHSTLARFGDRVSSVHAHLSGNQGPGKARATPIECMLEAHLVGLGPVVVHEHGRHAHGAIDAALRKLKRAVGRTLAQHDPRAHRLPAAAQKPFL